MGCIFLFPVKYFSCGFISTSTLLLSYCRCGVHVHAYGFAGVS